GNSLADAVPVTAPVALSSADACGDAVTPLLAASARKYHPGHYTIITNGVGAQSFMTNAIQQPGMVGIVRRYSWRSVEPSQGVYDFSVIKSDLAWATAHGAHFVVVITYKTVTPEKDGPAYLDAYESRNK